MGSGDCTSLESSGQMASYESLMKGTIYGAGDCTRGSRHSVLSMMVEDRLNTSVRPPQHLTKKEIAILRLWVDQGTRKTDPSPGNVRFREDLTHHQRPLGPAFRCQARCGRRHQRFRLSSCHGASMRPRVAINRLRSASVFGKDSSAYNAKRASNRFILRS